MNLDGWIILENRALAKRQQPLGLPLGYCTILIMTCLVMFLILHYFWATVWLFAFFWSIGKLVTYYDPFAWGILAKTLKLPQRLVP